MDSARLFPPTGVFGARRDKVVTKSAFHEFSSTQNLTTAWKAMYARTSVRSRSGFGIDRLSVAQFKETDLDRIPHLSKNIRNGAFSFNNLTAKLIPKSDGKYRVICIPTVKDRVVQRALTKTLYEYGYTLENSVNHGFVKGRSVKTAINKSIMLRNKYPWVFKVDIAAFFDNLDRGLLRKKIKKEIKHRSLHNILNSCANVEIGFSSHEERSKIRSQGIKKGVGIRQGMPLSPFFANLYLKEFDSFVERKKLNVVRYADDIIGFAKSESECKEMQSKCEETLRNINLYVKSSKTELFPPEQTVSFLGLGISYEKDGYKAIVTDVQLKRIKDKIYEYSNIDFCLRRNITLKNVLVKLDELTDSYQSVYGECHNKQKVSDVVVSSREKTLRDLFYKNFGLNYKMLTNNQRKFLGVGL